jgi:hypothetical protein
VKSLKIIAGALALAALHAAPVQAAKQFGTKEAVTINPAKAYVFFRATSKLPPVLLREVNEVERAAYEQERERAFVKAHAAYEKKLARWPGELAEYRKMPPAQRRMSTEPAKPRDFTLATFSYPPRELRNLIVVAPRLFTKDKPNYSYLVEVDPGAIRLYGIMGVATGAHAGICLCMGSVKFEAAAGKITDMGEIQRPRSEAIIAGDKKAAAVPSSLPSFRIVPPSAAMPVPARLAGLPVVQADYRAAGKMSNDLGLMIDRVPAMEGVLAYQRDTVVDVKAQGAGATGSR